MDVGLDENTVRTTRQTYHYPKSFLVKACEKVTPRTLATYGDGVELLERNRVKTDIKPRVILCS